jgi:hypothetical protein
VGLDRFSISKVLAGYLSNIFEFSYFSYVEGKILMHDIFIYYFYATTVNIPTGFYTPRSIHMGLRIFIMQ